MGNHCCFTEDPYDESKTTWITYDNMVQEFDDIDAPDIFSMANDPSQIDRGYSFKVRLSKFKGKKFCVNKWYIDIKVDNDNQNIHLTSEASTGKENIKWNLEQTFFF